MKRDEVSQLLNTQYGNVNEQLELVANQLAAIPELKSGFDAIGLSQGEYTCISGSFFNST